MIRDRDGYTLVELVVVMLIFSLVMTLISASFNRIVASSGQLSKSVETEIGGLIGLELLRNDLEAAGFGLPWKLPDEVTYQETTKGEMVPGYPGTAASSYNDPAPNEPPRPYRSGDNVGYNQSDYLVLKGTPLAMNQTSRCWAYLNYSSSTEAVIKQSKSGSELLLGGNERVVVLRSSIRSGAPQRELVTDGAGSSVFTLVYNKVLPGFLPKSKEEQYLVYGVAPKADGSANNVLAYPFNRSDYYLKRTSAMTRSCAKNTGVLYKTTIDHPGEKEVPEGEELEEAAPAYTPYPILDCVADFQVLFMMETSNDGTLVPHSDIGIYSAEQLRELLKEVRLYVMVQEGKQDPTYSYPIEDPGRVIVVGDRIWNKQKFVANDWLNYRWKVYTIVVQPKNL